MSRIEILKEKIPIEDLAEKLGVLDGAKKQNGEWKLCCLFHDEKTPSMCIIPRQGRFYCFGCAISGDALDLYMQVKGADRISGIQELEAMYGIEPLPYEPLKHFKRKPPSEDRGYTSERYGHPEWRQGAISMIGDPPFLKWWGKRGWEQDVMIQLAREGALGWAPIKKGSSHMALHFLFERGIKCRSDLNSSKSNWWKEGKARDCAWRVEALDRAGVDCVVITEGETDLISVLQHLELPDNMEVIGAPGASWHPNPLLTWRIGQGRHVILVGDNDEAGTGFCFRLRELFRKECDDCQISRIKWNEYPSLLGGAGIDEALRAGYKRKLLTDLVSRCA